MFVISIRPSSARLKNKRLWHEIPKKWIRNSELLSSCSCLKTDWSGKTSTHNHVNFQAFCFTNELRVHVEPGKACYYFHLNKVFDTRFSAASFYFNELHFTALSIIKTVSDSITKKIYSCIWMKINIPDNFP